MVLWWNAYPMRLVPRPLCSKQREWQTMKFVHSEGNFCECQNLIFQWPSRDQLQTCICTASGCEQNPRPCEKNAVFYQLGYNGGCQECTGWTLRQVVKTGFLQWNWWILKPRVLREILKFRCYYTWPTRFTESNIQKFNICLDADCAVLIG